MTADGDAKSAKILDAFHYATDHGNSVEAGMEIHGDRSVMIDIFDGDDDGEFFVLPQIASELEELGSVCLDLNSAVVFEEEGEVDAEIENRTEDTSRRGLPQGMFGPDEERRVRSKNDAVALNRIEGSFGEVTMKLLTRNSFEARIANQTDVDLPVLRKIRGGVKIDADFESGLSLGAAKECPGSREISLSTKRANSGFEGTFDGNAVLRTAEMCRDGRELDLGVDGRDDRGVGGFSAVFEETSPAHLDELVAAVSVRVEARLAEIDVGALNAVEPSGRSEWVVDEAGQADDAP